MGVRASSPRNNASFSARARGYLLAGQPAREPTAGRQVTDTLLSQGGRSLDDGGHLGVQGRKGGELSLIHRVWRQEGPLRVVRVWCGWKVRLGGIGRAGGAGWVLSQHHGALFAIRQSVTPLLPQAEASGPCTAQLPWACCPPPPTPPPAKLSPSPRIPGLAGPALAPTPLLWNCPLVAKTPRPHPT